MTSVSSALFACVLAVAPLAAQAAPTHDENEVWPPRLAQSTSRSPDSGRPLLQDGVLVVPETATSLAAFDAATGEPLWRFEDEKTPSPAQRTALLALSDGLVVLATPDARLIALELGSGRLRWQVKAAAPDRGYRYESPPLAVDGRVFAPMSGCAPGGSPGCWIAAYDSRTGAELWRRTLRAHPDSWPGSRQAERTDASATIGTTWVPPVYDPETGLLFVGLSAQGSAQGTAGGPHTLVTYALDAGTGAVEWLRWQSTKAGAGAQGPNERALAPRLLSRHLAYRDGSPPCRLRPDR